MFRIGQGFDVHRLVSGRKLVLCGVSVPHNTGLLGHSDADVALHAVMDAVLGALALGDIGHWFPDSSAEYKDADSGILLKSILDSSELKSWELNNLDVTIMAEKPKLSPFIQEMRQNLAKFFDCDINQVSVKATTTEKLGFCGREEGIAANATVLLRRKS